MTLSNPGGPITEPFEIFYRYGKDINTDTIDLYFRLKELTNTRASWSHLNVSVGFTDGLYTLTTPEFLSIGNMDDLLIEIEADVP
jgi:hypothetical protein